MFVLTALTPSSSPAKSWSSVRRGGDPAACRGYDGFLTPYSSPECSWSLGGEAEMGFEAWDDQEEWGGGVGTVSSFQPCPLLGDVRKACASLSLLTRSGHVCSSGVTLNIVLVSGRPSCRSGQTCLNPQPWWTPSKIVLAFSWSCRLAWLLLSPPLPLASGFRTSSGD